ncbi:MAG: Hsp33 family molecular chaperone HslO [Acidiferrobacterales bacterium]
MILDNNPIRAHDSLQRFLFENAAIRGQIVHLDATWRAVLERRRYPATLRAVLGECMVAAALLSATTKFTGRLVMQIQGRGPIQLLIVECTSDHTMRAMAKWTGNVPSGPLATTIGDGQLAITLEPYEGSERYQGIVRLVGNSIAEALENYFAHSEQLETRIWATADGYQAGGMLIQRLPTTDWVDPDDWPRAVHLSDTITRKELLTLPARDIIRRLYHEEDIWIFDSIPFGFRCSCSRNRVTDVLRLLGQVEIDTIIADEGRISVSCEFCNHHYEFDRVDAKQIFVTGALAGTSVRVH